MCELSNNIRYPFSFYKVLSSELPLKYLCAAFKIITLDDTNEGEDLRYIWPNTLRPTEKSDSDSKEAVSLLATSPVLIKCSLKKYMSILNVANNLCILGNRNRNGKSKDTGEDVLTRVALSLADLVNSKDDEGNYIYADNIDRVDCIINIIKKIRRRKDCSNDTWRNLMYAINFAREYKSCYYNDNQFYRIVDMLVSSEKKSGWLLLLFLNDYVPYMSDEEIDRMITFGSEKDISKILECAYELSSKSRQETLMSLLYSADISCDGSRLNDIRLIRKNYVKKGQLAEQ